MLWGNLSSTRGQTHKNWHQFLIQCFCFPQFEAYSTLTWTLTCVSINRSWAKNFFKFFSGLCHRVRLETWLILMRMHLLQVLMLPVENSVQNDWQWCLQLFLLLDFLVVVKKLSSSRNFNPINSVTMRKQREKSACFILSEKLCRELPLRSARSGELVTDPVRNRKWRTEADVILVFFYGFCRLQRCHMEVQNYEWWMWWVWFYSTSLLNFHFLQEARSGRSYM